jgi:NAD(P)-dependent dehydrogenase (short-subunit alcohol dehydrogenase family)
MGSIDFGLDGKVAVVTGAGASPEGVGIGSAVAVTLARAGARIALVDLAREPAEETLRLIEAEGATGRVFLADVSRDADCAQAVAAVADELGPPSVLVNNVGVAGPPGTVVDVDLDRWDEGMRINVKSMVMMSRYAIPHMVEQGGGSVVNMSSAAGVRGGHPAILYGTAKGAVIQMTRMMATHHGLGGVRVNAVAPGMVYTPMVRSRGLTDDMREIRRKRSLLQTEGTAWDVGNAVLYLASDLSRWVTGILLPVDAGYTSGTHLPTPPRK